METGVKNYIFWSEIQGVPKVRSSNFVHYDF